MVDIELDEEEHFMLLNGLAEIITNSKDLLKHYQEEPHHDKTFLIEHQEWRLKTYQNLYDKISIPFNPNLLADANQNQELYLKGIIDED